LSVIKHPRLLIRTLIVRIPFAVCILLAACNKPPPDAYVGGAPGTGALDLGKNTVQEACSLQRNGSDGQVYCGSYLEPAGRVVSPTQPADPVAFLTSSPWRTAFDSQFQCSSPVSTTVLDNPGATMSCTRRQGGWQHVVVATRIDGTLYVADGAKPTEAVLPRAIGVFAGKLPAEPAAATDTGLTTEREAAQAINVQGTGAIIEVNRQMARGAAENRKGNYAAAEIAYRTAISIQERAVGPDNPALAVPLAREALQLSNQGRYAEADQLFARAQRLQTLPGQIDPVAKPMVTEMRALDLLNRDKPQQALDLLNQAEPQFAALVPPEDLKAQVAPDAGAPSAVQRMAQAAEAISLMSDQSASDALNGLIETKRYRAIALNELGRTQEAEQSLQAAESLFSGRVPRLAARYYRTVGMTTPGRSDSSQALNSLGLAVDKFARGQPGTVPMAQTQLLRAGDLAARGDYTDALDDCRAAAQTLESLQRGVGPDLLMPCLHALSTQIAKGGQPVLREMFALAQMAQGSITSQQIALAAARLAAGSRDPKVAEAINAYDAATARVESLYRKRLEAAAEKNNDAAVAAIDQDIKKALDAQREAGQVRQEASPGFAALVQAGQERRLDPADSQG
jgi:tetratricopeptide (TPR) repeat protein